jgi:hypothetical protein
MTPLLTKDQRHTAYIILLQEYGKTVAVEEDGLIELSSYNLCHLIYKFFGIIESGLDPDYTGDWFWREYGDGSIKHIITLYFPELAAKKPKDGWPDLSEEGQQWRKQALQKCIEETYNF